MLINDTQKHDPQAYGVEFGLHTSRKYEVYAIYEVLLAAGSSVSPLLLEYSGIGMKKILDDVNVTQIVDLPVGVNMQDQTTTSIHNSIKVTGEGQGQGQAAYFATFNETFGDSIKRHLQLLTNETLHREWATEVVRRGGFHDVTALLVQYKNQGNQFKNHNVAYSELFLDTYGSINFDVWTLLPFSRGYIHIQNADPYLRKVDNNPRYFTNELDTLAQAAATRLTRDLSSAGSMSRYWYDELVPGIKKVPEDAGLDEWTTYVKGNYRSNWHAIGTASMMSRDLGGVVDSNAKVYGVKALRVVDGSIVPTQISSHVMTVFYGMAEKIAESISEDWKAQQGKSIGPEDEVPTVGILGTNSGVHIQGVGEGEGQGQVRLASVSDFDDVEVQSVLDGWVTVVSQDVYSDNLSAFAKFHSYATLAVLKYYKVDGDGKIEQLRRE